MYGRPPPHRGYPPYQQRPPPGPPPGPPGAPGTATATGTGAPWPYPPPEGQPGYGGAPRAGIGAPGRPPAPPGMGAGASWEGSPPPRAPPGAMAGGSASPYAPRPGPGPSPSPGMAAPTPRAEASTTLFVGSISAGVTDMWLERILQSCGPLRKLNRVKDLAGKPKAFGFAEYEEPESVLRALKVLNGVEVPSLDPGGGQAKKLVVKADEKTRVYLDQYESGRVKGEGEEELDSKARETIEDIFKEMVSGADSSDANKDDPGYTVPAHLRDLPPEELPEEQRGIVLSEIAMFRERAHKKEQERKRKEEEMEREREREWEMRRKREDAARNAQAASPPADRRRPAANGYGHGHGADSHLPYGKEQSYNKPMSFVRADAAGGGTVSSIGGDANAELDPEQQDEEEERRRREAKEREAEVALRDRERRWEARERSRLAAMERELGRERDEEAREQRERQRRLTLHARFDDDDPSTLPRGADYTFYDDRLAWREVYGPIRAREKEADEADKKREEEEVEKIRIESERFLAEQAAEMEALAQAQRDAGMLLDEGQPIKLSFTAKAAGGADGTKATVDHPEGKVAMGAAAGAAAAAAGAAGQTEHGAAGGRPVLLGEAEEEEEALRKKQRVLVPLEYGDGLTDEEREEKRKDKVRRMWESVPAQVDKLALVPIRWEWVDENMIDSKLAPLANEKIVEYLGAEEEELLSFVLEHVRERKGALELRDGLEPVLADEAGLFVEGFWKRLVFETLVAAAGISDSSF